MKSEKITDLCKQLAKSRVVVILMGFGKTLEEAQSEADEFINYKRKNKKS